MARTREKYIEAYETPDRPGVPLEMNRSRLIHAPLPDRRRVARAGPDRDRRRLPSGVALDTALINRELERRQGGYGRGKRQTLETDRIIVDSGVYHGVTTGGPITLRLINNDAKLERLTEPASPRGGHIDLAGSINYQTGIRQVLERASARETALAGRRRRAWPSCCCASWGSRSSATSASWAGSPRRRCRSTWRSATPARSTRSNPEADPAIVAAIDAAREAGDTLGGIVEAIVTGCPIGLGSHAQWDRKLDARLAAAVMSIQAIKAVEIGLGVEAARRPGSKVMDPIAYEPDHPRRRPPLRLPPADEQRRRDRRRDVQRRADRRPRGQEADQHAGRPRTVDQHGDQGPPARRLRTLRRLRRARPPA